jgi:hypothetical protein
MSQARRQSNRTRRKRNALAGVLSLLAAQTANAQIVDNENQFGVVKMHESEAAKYPLFNRALEMNTMTVNDTDRHLFLPDGIRSGNYLIFPEASFALLKNENMFGLQNDANGKLKGLGDIRRETLGSVQFVSQLPRHVLDFMFSGRLVSFQDHDERNYGDGLATVQARLDINHNYAFIGNFLSKIDHEERRDIETPANARRLSQVWINEGDAYLMRSAGHLSMQAGGTAGHTQYQAIEAFDGGRIAQSFRDTDRYSGYFKVRYQLAPGYTLMGRLTGLMEENRGTPAFNRSNHGYEATTGLEFELTRLLRGSVEGGYTERLYDQDAKQDLRLAIFASRMIWMATPRLTFYFDGRRHVAATGVNGALGRIDLRFNGSFEYELQRNLVLSGGLEHVGSDFVGSSRHDDRWVLSAGGKYYFNKHVYLGLEIGREMVTSTSAAAEFEANRIMATLKFRQ